MAVGELMRCPQSTLMNAKLISLALTALSVYAPAADVPSLVTTDVVQHTNPANADITVSVDAAEKKEGIRLRLPDSVSASKRGSEVEFTYHIINATNDALFIEVEPVETLPSVYRDRSGNRVGSGGRHSMGPHGRRYALLHPNKRLLAEGLVHCCSIEPRKARIELPEIAQAGGDLKVSIFVSGYYLKDGQAFSGKIEATIQLSE